VVGGKLVLNYLADAKSQLKIASLDGKRQKTDVPLPTLGSVEALSGDQDRPELFYSFNSFVFPAAIYRYDVSTGKNEVFRKPSVADFFGRLRDQADLLQFERRYSRANVLSCTVKGLS